MGQEKKRKKKINHAGPVPTGTRPAVFRVERTRDAIDFFFVSLAGSMQFSPNCFVVMCVFVNRQLFTRECQPPARHGRQPL